MGVPEFNKITQISANPSKSVELLDLSFNDVIDSGGKHQVLIYSPEGFISKCSIMYLIYDVIANATIGTKEIKVTVTDGLLGIMSANISHEKILYYWYGQWREDALAQLPLDKVAQFHAQENVFFDAESPLRITFSNNTDVSDVGMKKTLRLWVIQEKIQ